VTNPGAPDWGTLGTGTPCGGTAPTGGAGWGCGVSGAAGSGGAAMSGGGPVSPKFWFVLAALAFIGATPARNNESLVVTYTHGTLHVTIPYPGDHPIQGQMTVDVLDPEDRKSGTGYAIPNFRSWEADIALPVQLPLDELVWHRLRYKFVPSNPKAAPFERIESLSQVLHMPLIHIVGQQSYLSGGSAAVRVVATDSSNRPIEGRSTLRIDLLIPNHSPRLLFTGLLDRRGTAKRSSASPRT
jgi:hypothetical protein